MPFPATVARGAGQLDDLRCRCQPVLGGRRVPALVAFDPRLIPFSQQTRLSRLTHELQQAALESGQLIGQALTLSEKTRQLSQTAIETAESLLLKDQEDEAHEDEQSG